MPDDMRLALKITGVDDLSGVAARARRSILRLGDAGKQVRRDFDLMNKALKGAAIAGVGTYAIAKGLKPAVGFASDLQAELLGTRAELEKTGMASKKIEEDMQKIKQTAFDVQAWTPFDISQIVSMEKALKKAGAEVVNIVGKTGAAAATAALAVYENLDPTLTGKAIIGIGTPFKIDASGYMDLADNISRAASASTVGAEEIAETAQYAAGPLANLGKSSKEMLALSAMMAQVGVTGSRAGTAIKNFFLAAASHKVFQDANGNMKSTVEIIDILRKKLAGMGDAERSQVLKKLFSERGLPVGIAMLNQGAGSYEQIMKAMSQSITLMDKLNLSMRGFGKQLESFSGTSKSDIALLFQSALKPLTAVVEKANELAAALGKIAMQKGSVGKAVSNISLGAVGVGGLATLGFGAAGLFYGRRMLKRVGGIRGMLDGMGDTAAGIAKGKALQKATGVTPVYVTNWPDNFSGGVGKDLTSIAKKSGGFFGKVGGFLTSGFGFKNLLRSSPAAIQAMGGGAMLGSGLSVAAAGAGGYALGTGLNELMGMVSGKITEGKYNGSGWLGELLYDAIHKKEPDQNKINLSIKIDQAGRAMTETDGMNTHVKTAVKRGSF